jgi:hypothetical protein
LNHIGGGDLGVAAAKSGSLKGSGTRAQRPVSGFHSLGRLSSADPRPP